MGFQTNAHTGKVYTHSASRQWLLTPISIEVTMCKIRVSIGHCRNWEGEVLNKDGKIEDIGCDRIIDIVNEQTIERCEAQLRCDAEHDAAVAAGRNRNITRQELDHLFAQKGPLNNHQSSTKLCRKCEDKTKLGKWSKRTDGAMRLIGLPGVRKPDDYDEMKIPTEYRSDKAKQPKSPSNVRLMNPSFN